MSNKIELKPINSILGECFYIPSYQRGYRWTSEQVEALLDDLWEFKKDKYNLLEAFITDLLVYNEKLIGEDFEFEKDKKTLNSPKVVIQYNTIR